MDAPTVDLPEPKRPEFSPAQKVGRDRRLIVTMATLAVSYSCVHKVMVPTFLKFTPLVNSPYSKIDLWFIHSLTFLFSLYLLPKSQTMLSLLSGAGVAYGGVEVAEVYLGHFPGWLAISRLLSSIPIAGLCIAILSGGKFPVRPAYAWAGAFVACAILYIAVRGVR